jgi:hypothetical protein
MRSARVFLVAILFLFSSIKSLNADAPAIDFVSGTTSYPATDTIHGWEFVVNSTIAVTHLGLFDSGDNGLALRHPIGLFRLNDSRLLTSGNMDAGTIDPIQGDFRYIDTPDVTLAPGVSYVISFYTGHDDADLDVIRATSLSVNPVITITNSRWDNGSLRIPSHILTNGDVRYGPSFLFQVPEPNSTATVAVAATYVGLLLRRRMRHESIG